MWKKRDTHIVDIYKNQNNKSDLDQDQLDSRSIGAKTDLAMDPATDIATGSSSASVARVISKIRTTSSKRIYQGKDFDIFGKEEAEEHFAPLYSIEQFTPKHNKQKERYKKGEILLRPEHQEFKRGQVEVIATMIKKRKVVIDSPHIFIKSTAAANTPIARIFVEPSEEHEDDTIDLAYS
jgi:hypothetical protein